MVCACGAQPAVCGVCVMCEQMASKAAGLSGEIIEGNGRARTLRANLMSDRAGAKEERPAAAPAANEGATVESE